MSRLEKLYEKAKLSPYNFSFNDLCTLLEGVDFVCKRQKGSHRIYKHPLIEAQDGMIPIQKIDGKAVPYQVKQAVNLIDKYELI